MKALIATFALVSSLSGLSKTINIAQECPEEVKVLEEFTSQVAEAFKAEEVNQANVITIQLATSGIAFYAEKCEDITALLNPIRETFKNLKE